MKPMNTIHPFINTEIDLGKITTLRLVEITEGIYNVYVLVRFIGCEKEIELRAWGRDISTAAARTLEEYGKLSNAWKQYRDFEK